MTLIGRGGAIGLGRRPLRRRRQFILHDQWFGRFIPGSVGATHPVICVFFVVVVAHGTL
jgi:hypothetical protein